MTGYPSGQDGPILSARDYPLCPARKIYPKVESFIDQYGGILTKLFDVCLQTFIDRFGP